MGTGTRSTGNVSVRYAMDLLRSLVGVEDARVVTDAKGVFQCVEVVPEAGVADHAVVRNVTSALRATLDIQLGPETVRVVAQLPQLGPVGPTHLVLVPGGIASTTTKPSDDASSPATHPAPSRRARASAGEPSTPLRTPAIGPRTEPGIVAATSGSLAYELAEGQARRISLDTAAESDAALPHLESVELDRDERRMRCRVVVSADGQRHAAMAVSGIARGAEVQIGARAAVDALRAVGGRLADLSLEGASLTRVGGRPHVIASVQRWGIGHSDSLAGTAEVAETPEKAAALAVLRAALQSTEAEH